VVRPFRIPCVLSTSAGYVGTYSSVQCLEEIKVRTIIALERHASAPILVSVIYYLHAEVSVLGYINWLRSLLLRSLRLRPVHANDDVRSLVTDHLGACADSPVTANFLRQERKLGAPGAQVSMATTLPTAMPAHRRICLKQLDLDEDAHNLLVAQSETHDHDASWCERTRGEREHSRKLLLRVSSRACDACVRKNERPKSMRCAFGTEKNFESGAVWTV
jgi:hypothetical protein